MEMKKFQEVFERKEVKFLLSQEKYQALLDAIKSDIKPDVYFEGTNCSVYYDTEDFQLASRSLEHPVFKQKVRVRSYGTPKTAEAPIYLEIKKKFKGVGNKRRICLKLSDFNNYIKTGRLKTDNTQIKSELDYCFKYYDLKPAIYIAYDRNSYCDAHDSAFRLTFDQNIRSRLHDLHLESGSDGKKYFHNNEVVMEAKTLNAFPSWFIDACSDLKIYPSSFQKYGFIYQSRFSEIKERTKNV